MHSYVEKTVTEMIGPEKKIPDDGEPSYYPRFSKIDHAYREYEKIKSEGKHLCLIISDVNELRKGARDKAIPDITPHDIISPNSFLRFYSAKIVIRLRGVERVLKDRFMKDLEVA